MIRGVIIATIAALALGTTALPGHAQGRHSRLSAQDRAFVMKAAEDGATEVQLGQLAVSKRSGRRVQQFGQRMIQDHSAANNKLMSIAADRGVRLPTDPRRAMGAEGRATFDSLNRLNGDSFSRAYMAHMVTNHRKAVAMFQREARLGHDPMVRSFARNTLPTLQDHLGMADDVEAMVLGRPRTQFAHRRMHM